MPALAEVAREKLQALEHSGQRRRLGIAERQKSPEIIKDGQSLISFGCNDYLGLTQHPDVKAAAAKALARWGTGAGASRLITGNHPLYGALERRLAAWKGTEAALVFGSGYLTNIGVLSALVGKGDVILADRLVHASLIDGAKLSGAKLLRFRHNDISDCERLLRERARYRHCLIVTDEVFSMDGDLAPLSAFAELALKYDAWTLADGAHSFTGRRAPVDIYTGTLSKALAGYGGFIAADKQVIDYLATHARSFMFSTGLPPGVVAAADAALEQIQKDPLLAALPLAKARQFTEAAGLPPAQSAIVPLILGQEGRALDAAARLEQAGYLVPAIRPPTVPANTSRLRFAFCALHRDQDIVELAGIVKKEGWV